MLNGNKLGTVKHGNSESDGEGCSCCCRARPGGGSSDTDSLDLDRMKQVMETQQANFVDLFFGIFFKVYDLV